jgi:hypothetical protein
MYKVKILPLAQSNVKSAFDWYEVQKEGLGQEFKNHLIKSIKRLESSPDDFQVRYSDVRGIKIIIQLPG